MGYKIKDSEVIAVGIFMLLVIIGIAVIAVFLFLSVIFAISPSEAKAEVPIQATFYRVHSANAVTDAEYEYILYRVRYQYRKEMNVKIRLRQKHIWDAPMCYWYPDYDLEQKALYMYFWKWAYWADDKKLYKKRAYGFIVGGAETPEKYQYSWGLAHRGCHRKGHKYFVATAVSDNGNGGNRLDYSAMVIAHELAHTCDARHVDSNTIMRASLGDIYEDNKYIPFSPKSIKQVKECLAK